MEQVMVSLMMSEGLRWVNLGLLIVFRFPYLTNDRKNYSKIVKRGGLFLALTRNIHCRRTSRAERDGEKKYCSVNALS